VKSAKFPVKSNKPINIHADYVFSKSVSAVFKEDFFPMEPYDIKRFLSFDTGKIVQKFAMISQPNKNQQNVSRTTRGAKWYRLSTVENRNNKTIVSRSIRLLTVLICTVDAAYWTRG